MKPTILSILFSGILICLTIKTYSQSPKTIEVGKQEFSSFMRSSAFDNAGNTYHGGFFRGALTINNDTLLYGNGNNDYFVVKVDSSGQPIWGLNIGSEQNEQSDISILYQHDHVFVGFTVRNPFSIGNTQVTDITPGVNTSVLLKLDTAGNLVWLKKTNAVINKVLPGKGNLMLQCTVNSIDPPTYFEDSLIFEPNSFNNRLFISINEDGEFIQCKSIFQNTSGIISIVSLVDTTRNRLYFLVITPPNSIVFGGNNLFVGNNPVLLPSTPNSYVLLKTDSSLNLISSKVLNPSGVGYFIGTFNPARLRFSADSMHLNLLVNAGMYSIDGFNANLNDANSLIVFDTSLATQSIKTINQNLIVLGSKRNTIHAVEEDADAYYLLGTTVANNQSNSINAIPENNIEFSITESFKQMVNINGPSKSYILKTDKLFNKIAFNWIGETSVYESTSISVDEIQPKNNHLHFLVNQDNVWNPWKVSKELIVKYGGFKPNADGSDYAENVGFFSNKSSYIVGTTSGLNLFDTSNAGIISANTRSDCYVAILDENGTLKKYHRIFSSFSANAPIRVRMYNDTLYALVAFITNRNQAGFNYIKVDTITRLVSGVAHRALFKIDPNGGIQHMDFYNTQVGIITDFDIYENGDIALLSFSSTLAPNLNGQQFPAANGFFKARMQPNGTITQAIKIASSSILGTLNPQKIQLENNQEIAGLLIQTSFRNNLPELNMVHYRNGNQQSTKTIPNPSPELSAQRYYLMLYRLSSTQNLGTGLVGPVNLTSQSGFTSSTNNKSNILYFNNGITGPINYNNQGLSSPASPHNSFIVSLDSNLQYVNHLEFKPDPTNTTVEFRALSVKSIKNQFYFSGWQHGELPFGSLKIPHQGNGDGLTLKTDSALNILQYFKVSSTFSELNTDFAIHSDSTFMVGYRSQTKPTISIGANSIPVLNNTTQSVKQSDFAEMGYVTLSPPINLPNDFVFSIKNGGWHETSTWNTGKIPGATDKVFIKHKVQVDGPAKCFTLFVDPNADLQLVAGNQLEILGVPQQ